MYNTLLNAYFWEFIMLALIAITIIGCIVAIILLIKSIIKDLREGDVEPDIPSFMKGSR